MENWGRLVAGVVLFVIGVWLLYPLAVILAHAQPLDSEMFGQRWGGSILATMGTAAIVAGFVVLWPRRR
jgi:uncharacterized iron-regulated membrane protein